MAELDTITVCNPTDEDIEIGYNGEPYTLSAGQVAERPQHLARHIAKKLSDRMCMAIALAEEEKLKKKKEPIPQTLRQQIGMLDNPHRRIALYKILKSKEEVERTIKAYPQFKASDAKFNFVGEMEVYDSFVAEYTKPKEEKTETVAEKMQTAKAASIKGTQA